MLPVPWTCFKNRSNVLLLSNFSADKKSDPSKGKLISSDLGTLYPAPKISNPSLNLKLRWGEILPFSPHNYFLLAPNRIILGIGNYHRFLCGIPLLFSPLDFTMLLHSWGTTWMVKWRNGETNLPTMGFYYDYPFLWNYIYFKAILLIWFGAYLETNQ